MKSALTGLALCAGSTVFVAGAHAGAEPHALEHVLVSVPLHRQRSETALPVTVISGEALRAQAAATIGETLANTPGLANASFGPGVGQPVIRGQQGPRTAVLVNGLGSADAASVSADHAVSVEPLLADSVEVLRGPATLLYGGGAIGGVVNVIDNRVPSALPDAVTGGFEQRHDSAADADTTVARLSFATGSLAWHLDGLYRDWNAVEIPGLAFDRRAMADLDESSDGYIANSDGRTRTGTLGLSWIGDLGYIGLAYNRLDNDYGIPPGAHDPHDPLAPGEDHHDAGIRLDITQDRYDIAAERRDLGVLQAVRWRVSYSDYQHRELEGSGEVGTVFHNTAWEHRLELAHRPLAGWTGALGVQWLDRDFGAMGAEAFIPEVDIQRRGVFLVEDYHLDAWTFELGLRVDRDSTTPRNGPRLSHTAVSGSASVLWAFHDNYGLGLAFSRATRAPVVEELLSNAGLADINDCVVHAATGACEQGNPALDTERSHNLDISLNIDQPRYSGFVTVYYNDFQDYIHLADTGLTVDEAPVLRYTQRDARFVGVEAELRVPLANNASGEWAVTASGDWLRGTLTGAGERGDSDVPRLPPRRLGLRLDWSRLAWAGSLSVWDAADQNRPGWNQNPTAGYTRWDAGLDYRLDWKATEVTLFLKGRNLSDEEIRLSTSFLREVAPEAGRSLELGFRVEF